MNECSQSALHRVNEMGVHYAGYNAVFIISAAASKLHPLTSQCAELIEYQPRYTRCGRTAFPTHGTDSRVRISRAHVDGEEQSGGGRGWTHVALIRRLWRNKRRLR